MGGWLSSLFGNKPVRILLRGLDAAGKTTILYKLKLNLGEVEGTVIPTMGFNFETLETARATFTMLDMGGGEKLRQLHHLYYKGTQAIIFVVDSTDVARMDAAKQELDRLLWEEDLRTAALLVFANKQDLPNALSAETVAERLGLPALVGRQWYAQDCSGTTGEGLYEGLDWVAAVIA